MKISPYQPPKSIFISRPLPAPKLPSMPPVKAPSLPSPFRPSLLPIRERFVMQGFGGRAMGALNESLYLPPDNVEWMIPEYQNLSPESSVTDIGVDAPNAPSYVSDTVNNSVAPVVTSQTDTSVVPMSNSKKAVMVGAGLTALFFALK